MKRIIQKISPEWVLRISLAVMYFYSGVDIMRHPSAWHWAIRPLPQFMQDIIQSIGIDTFLTIQGAIEVLFGIILILWFLPKVLSTIVALFSAVEMLAILIFTGIDAITFRDIGLLGASFALFIILIRRGGNNTFE
jgi:uncharacterized membrane protein YphA (DoxX/SURF4 family)